jgi:hypothetical protein
LSKKQDSWRAQLIYTPKNPQGVYPIEKQAASFDSKDKKLWKNTGMNKEDIKFIKIYAVKNNKPELIGHQCPNCSKVFKNPEVVLNHKNVCKSINTISK